jgi:hypothetical protein
MLFPIVEGHIKIKASKNLIYLCKEHHQRTLFQSVYSMADSGKYGPFGDDHNQPYQKAYPEMNIWNNPTFLQKHPLKMVSK